MPKISHIVHSCGGHWLSILWYFRSFNIAVRNVKCCCSKIKKYCSTLSQKRLVTRWCLKTRHFYTLCIKEEVPQQYTVKQITELTCTHNCCRQPWEQEVEATACGPFSGSQCSLSYLFLWLGSVPSCTSLCRSSHLALNHSSPWKTCSTRESIFLTHAPRIWCMEVHYDYAVSR